MPIEQLGQASGLTSQMIMQHSANKMQAQGQAADRRMKMYLANKQMELKESEAALDRAEARSARGFDAQKTKYVARKQGQQAENLQEMKGEQEKGLLQLKGEQAEKLTAMQNKFTGEEAEKGRVFTSVEAQETRKFEMEKTKYITEAQTKLEERRNDHALGQLNYVSLQSIRLLKAKAKILGRKKIRDKTLGLKMADGKAHDEQQLAAVAQANEAGQGTARAQIKRVETTLATGGNSWEVDRGARSYVSDEVWRKAQKLSHWDIGPKKMTPVEIGCLIGSLKGAVSQMQGAMGALQDAAATGTTAKATQRGILLDVNRTIAGEPVDTRGSYAQRSLQSTINELNAMLQRVVDATQYGKPGGIVSVEQNNSARDIYHKDGVAAEEAGVNEGAAILDALEQKILDEEAARAKKTY